MNTIKSIIIDDEKHARESLSCLLKLYCPNVEIIGEADNILVGKKMIKQTQPDLVFLDISIGENTGFELLEALIPINFNLIFTTAFTEYALQAFRVNAIDYLLKPIDPTQLKTAVEKVIQNNNSHQLQIQLMNLAKNLSPTSSQQIMISNTNAMTFLEINDIVHIEGSANYSTFYLIKENPIIASKGLKHFESILPSDCFYRSHQSHLVNVKHIKKISTAEGNVIVFKNSMQVPIAKTRKEGLMKLLLAKNR